MAFLFYFDDMNFVNLNGKLIEKEKANFSPDNHSYRYGDGLFETMKLMKGSILLGDHHFVRLFSGLNTLKFKIPILFTKQIIDEQIRKLCKKNNCEELARIRLSVSRGNGGLNDCDNDFSYVIECWPLDQSVLNQNGLVIDIFPDAKKSIDIFSNLKSANYLPYVMAAIWAKENKLNDALILNQHERICDSTIANVFWVKDDKIFTPPLSEGGISGVMRRRILETESNVYEANLTKNILMDADEVFLTNVIKEIRWIKQCGNKIYDNKMASKIFTHLVQTISS